VAKELTGQYFALPDDWFDASSHDIRTLKDLRRGEILGQGRLAQIRKVYRVLGEVPGRFLRCESVCPHYRICLQDHNILARLARDGEVSLPDLLTCVLTHEYVHLVRFCRLEHAYESGEDRRAEEEARVGDITHAILSGFGHRGLRLAAHRMRPQSRSEQP
jgi:hypothetical protein